MSKGIRRDERTPVGWMVVHGLIASAVGIAAGLAIDWFPEEASTQAGPIDHLYDVLIWVSVPVFVTVMIIVLFSVVNFRMRPGEEELDGPPIHGNTRLEVIWTAVPAILLVALCTYSYVVLVDIEEAKANEMAINVTGQQFAWTYEYPQAGGKPVKSTVLYLPKDRPVRFNVKALDVLHDFWVPAFRMKIDAVPGLTTHFRITPSRLGTYPVVCAELCGLGHSVMRSTTKVVTPAAFDKWLADQKAPAGASRRRGSGARGARRRRRRRARRDVRRRRQGRGRGRQADLRGQRLRRLPHPGRRGHELADRARPRRGPQGQGRRLHPQVDHGSQRGDRRRLPGHHAQGLRR